MGKKILAVLFTGCVCGLLVSAQSNSIKPDPTDRKFMNNAMQNGLAEVQLGQLAKQKAASPAVKAYAARIVKAYRRLNDQLKMIASSQGVALPTTPSAKDQALYNRLSRLSGPDFDKAYLDAIVAADTMELSEIQKEAQSAKDDALRSFASTTQPILQQLLQEARQAESTIGTSAPQ